MGSVLIGFTKGCVNTSKKDNVWTSLLTLKPGDVKPKKIKFICPSGTDIFEMSEKPLPTYSSYYVCDSHKSGGGLCSIPDFLPRNYVRKTKSGDYEYTLSYRLDKLWAKEKGDGTSGVQSVVLKSLTDNDTRGRVMLDACCIDGKTVPGAFYYKLGFRFCNPINNKECEQWIKSGGKYQDAPSITGMMYLPSENIEHCLKYGDEKSYYKYIFPRYAEEIKRAINF